MGISVVILAAGQGTRMRSTLPKVLHRIAGKQLVQHVIDRARDLGCSDIHLIYGHGGDQVQQEITGNDITWINQQQQLGTGHAVIQAMPGLANCCRLFTPSTSNSSSAITATTEQLSLRAIAIMSVR